MPHIPFIGRLSVREYFLVFGTLIFVVVDSLLRFLIFFIPKPIINWFYKRSRSIFHRFSSHEWTARERRIHHARDFEELCHIYGYRHEEHVVLTKDGYLLGLHRLPSKKGQQKTHPGTSTGNPVVYLHHGLLMSSEVWVCLTDEERALPFVLVEQGYDVWLGNNRGNKYSRKSLHYSPNSTKFWDYSMDDFAWHDIPDTVEYILEATKEESLSYIGFSQGTAQAFAALSIHPQLNTKVNVFIALAPAMSPPGLAAPMVDELMKASPTLLYLIFGRKAILSSTKTWQSILYPPIFSYFIDLSLSWLFDWQSKNISDGQKSPAHAHLYSYCSVKSVVHWFQIMRSGEFVMFDDDVGGIRISDGVSKKVKGKKSHYYRPARFPTRNIVTPIVLLYGDSDSLVDIDVMLSQLPQHSDSSNVTVRCLHGYEHLDILWGKDVDKDVIPHVLSALKRYTTGEQDENWLEGSTKTAPYVNGTPEGEATDATSDD
ncbi:triacylglycerol lipase [Mycena floridula]|nr:triacylglycerol lipase [Mycena floridula]